jgi:hypothetical protein
VWVSSLSEPENGVVDVITAKLEQGPGNMDSGCLFTLTKMSGEPTRVHDYRFHVSGENGVPVTLKWPEDANMTISIIDSDLKENDERWWDTGELIGFDAPPGLTGIEDGDKIIVEILNIENASIVFSSSFTYRS